MTQIKVEPTKTISLDAALAMMNPDRSTPDVLTERNYADAVVQLARLAMSACGAARVAAQVLLSCYNGNNYHVNLVDLCNLDVSNYKAAIIVIRARVELNREPHEVISHGDAIFDSLQEEWKHYHVNRRYKTHE